MMAIDPLSPVASARINTLLVPAGKIRRTRFSHYVSRLEGENVIRLGDPRLAQKLTAFVVADMFSPLAFPEGRMVYNFSLSASPALSVECFPFELNREAQVILYLADASEVTFEHAHVELQQGNGDDESSEKCQGESKNIWTLKSLEDEVRASRPQYRRAILHQLLIFDSVAATVSPSAPTDALFVPPPEKSRSTTIRTVMCDITARLLHSMDDLAHEIQDFSTIESPSSTNSLIHTAADITARVSARMSMPGQPTDSSFEPAGSRYSAVSSNYNRSTTPAGARSASRNSVASTNRIDRLSEGSSAFGSRDVSQDRMSGLQPSVTTPTERRKSRSIARSRIVVGALYLQAGLWPDAMKDLSEGTTMARSNNDYVWHAKGLEYIIACLLMFGWAEMYFQIPHICYPVSDKPTLSKQSSATPGSSTTELAPYGRGTSDSRTVSLHYLTKLLPGLLHSINTLYVRAFNFTQEALPQLLMSESLLRSGYLLSAMYLRNGIIDDDMLRALVASKTIPIADLTSRSTETVSPRKSEIATILLQAVPTLPETVPLNELIQILIGSASILSMISMERKQAFVLKELLQRLIPALVEARKMGAAEMGIHPAAGLLALSNASQSGFLRVEEGMKSLLTSVGVMYGAIDDEEDSKSASRPQNMESAASNTSRRTQLHAYGYFDLKVDILKSCIAICEVLPDFEGVLKYTVHLLHLSRRAIILPFHQPARIPAISQEEQTRLIDGIKRTVGAAAKVGLKNIQAHYWDDFLVRGIEVVSPAAALRVTLHSKNELQSTGESDEAVKQGPFIYNPYSKPTSSATEQPLVADELAYFNVYLQNPYEVDVEIDEVSLLAEGCDFQPLQHSIVLGHFCCQRFTMAGTPRSSGNLKIIGCRAKIRHCKERIFYITPTGWRPDSDTKTQTISYAASKSARSRPPPSALENNKNAAEASRAGLEVETVSLVVLHGQPVVSVQSTTLPQPALMVLEGEKRSFDIVLKNESDATAVDLVLFTFEDSATTQLRTALMNKELSPIELYELELQLSGRTPLRHLSPGGKDEPAIPAGGTATFSIAVLGIPGLLKGVVQIHYAHLGLKPMDVKDKFYTRQLAFPVAVTVNAGIEVPRCNMLPFSGDFAWWNRERASGSSRQEVYSSGAVAPELRSRSSSYALSHTDGGQFTSLLARLELGSHGDDHCLLLLDLRNVWPFPLSASVQVRESPSASSSATDPWRRAYTVHESLQPGHVSRVVLLVPRVFVSDPHAPIPLIGNQRQFVVSASKLSVDAEQANREAFWYREELLKHIRGNWREDSTGREGTIDLRRGIRLSAKMIEALKIEDVEISMSIQPSIPPSIPSSLVRQDGRSRFTLQTSSFVNLTIKVHNRSPGTLHVLLRIQPSLRDQPHNIALDLSKRLAWTGMLQRVLHPPLARDEIRQASLGIMALCIGEYEIAATVEELKALPQYSQGRKTDISIRSNDRRIWHAREPCLISAVNSIQP